MLGGIGFGEWALILLVVLLLFGAKRVPEIARSLGQSMSEFKKGLNSAAKPFDATVGVKPESINTGADQKSSSERKTSN